MLRVLVFYIIVQFFANYSYSQNNEYEILSKKLTAYNFQLFQDVIKNRLANYKKIYVYDMLEGLELGMYKENEKVLDSLKKYLKDKYDYPIYQTDCCLGTWTQISELKQLNNVIFIPKRKADDFIFENDSLYNSKKIVTKEDLVCIYPINFIIKQKHKEILYSIVLITKHHDETCDMSKGYIGWLDLYKWNGLNWISMTTIDKWGIVQEK